MRGGEGGCAHLARDVFVGEADSEPVLRRVVLVLVLRRERESMHGNVSMHLISANGCVNTRDSGATAHQKGDCVHHSTL